jgi:hypothetical protein
MAVTPPQWSRLISPEAGSKQVLLWPREMFSETEMYLKLLDFLRCPSCQARLKSVALESEPNSHGDEITSELLHYTYYQLFDEVSGWYNAARFTEVWPCNDGRRGFGVCGRFGAPSNAPPREESEQRPAQSEPPTQAAPFIQREVA